MTDIKFTYDVFISYNNKDKVFVEHLYQALTRYKPARALKKTKLEVYDYIDDAKGTNYKEKIKEELAKSKKMFLICSPNAAQSKSKAVHKEIKEFANNRAKKHIIPILLHGKPNNEAQSKEEKAFPDVLLKLFNQNSNADLDEVIAIAVDYRELKNLTYQTRRGAKKEAAPIHVRARAWITDRRARNEITKGAHESDWYTLLAHVYDLSRSEVEQRERKRRKFWRRFWTSVVIGVLISLSAAWYFNRQANEQLARNHWGAGVVYRDLDKPVLAAHFFAKAVASPDDNLADAARLAATHAIRGASLKEIVTPQKNDSDSMELEGFVFNENKDVFISWSEKNIFVQNVDGSMLLEAKFRNGNDSGAVFNHDESFVLSWESSGDQSYEIRKWSLKHNHKMEEVEHKSVNLELPESSEVKFRGAAHNEKKNQFLTWSSRRVWLWNTDNLANSEIELNCGAEQEHEPCNISAITKAIFNENQSQILIWGKIKGRGKYALWILEVKESSDGLLETKHIGILQHDRIIDAIAINQAGTLLMSWDDKPQVRFWSTEAGKQVKTDSIESEVEKLYWARISDNEDFYLELQGSKNSTRLRSTNTMKGMTPPLYHSGNVSVAILTSNETIVRSREEGGLFRLWDITPQPSRAEADDIKIFNKAIVKVEDKCSNKQRGINGVDNSDLFGCLSYNDPNHLLVWGKAEMDGKDIYSVVLWNVKGPEKLSGPLFHDSKINGARLDKKRKKILSWSNDKTVRLWDSNTDLWDNNTGRLLLPPMIHENQVMGARFYADDERIISWDSANRVYLWDALRGVEVTLPLFHPSTIENVAFNNAETCIVVKTIVDITKERKYWLWALDYDKDADSAEVSEFVKVKTGTMLSKEAALVIMDGTVEKPTAWENLKRMFDNFKAEGGDKHEAVVANDNLYGTCSVDSFK